MTRYRPYGLTYVRALRRAWRDPNVSSLSEARDRALLVAEYVRLGLQAGRQAAPQAPGGVKSGSPRVPPPTQPAA